MKQLLYIDACVRKGSRTKRLAEALLQRLVGAEGAYNVKKLILKEEEKALQPLHESNLVQRNYALMHETYDDPMYYYAKEFAAADIILIAAPYWDFSFPAVLKLYLEHVSVNGIAFRYENDRPIGLCRAGMLYYVTTAGGEIGSRNLGYEYVKQLTRGLFGVRDTQCIMADGLDLEGVDAEAVLQNAERAIYSDPNIFSSFFS